MTRNSELNYNPEEFISPKDAPQLRIDAGEKCILQALDLMERTKSTNTPGNRREFASHGSRPSQVNLVADGTKRLKEPDIWTDSPHDNAARYAAARLEEQGFPSDLEIFVRHLISGTAAIATGYATWQALKSDESNSKIGKSEQESRLDKMAGPTKRDLYRDELFRSMAISAAELKLLQARPLSNLEGRRLSDLIAAASGNYGPQSQLAAYREILQIGNKWSEYAKRAGFEEELRKAEESSAGEGKSVSSESAEGMVGKQNSFDNKLETKGLNYPREIIRKLTSLAETVFTSPTEALTRFAVDRAQSLAKQERIFERLGIPVDAVNWNFIKNPLSAGAYQCYTNTLYVGMQSFLSSSGTQREVLAHEAKHMSNAIESTSLSLADPVAYERRVLESTLEKAGDGGPRFRINRDESKAVVSNRARLTESGRQLLREAITEYVASNASLSLHELLSQEKYKALVNERPFQGELTRTVREVKNEYNHYRLAVMATQISNDALLENKSLKALVDRKVKHLELVKQQSGGSLYDNPKMIQMTTNISDSTTGAASIRALPVYKYKSAEEMSARRHQYAQGLREIARDLTKKAEQGEIASGKVKLGDLIRNTFYGSLYLNGIKRENLLERALDNPGRRTGVTSKQESANKHQREAESNVAELTHRSMLTQTSGAHLQRPEPLAISTHEKDGIRTVAGVDSAAKLRLFVENFTDDKKFENLMDQICEKAKPEERKLLQEELERYRRMPPTEQAIYRQTELSKALDAHSRTGTSRLGWGAKAAGAGGIGLLIAMAASEVLNRVPTQQSPTSRSANPGVK